MRSVSYSGIFKTAMVLGTVMACFIAGQGITAGTKGTALTVTDPEGHFQIALNNTDARVNMYRNSGRITRIYGEAFSHGATPVQSADAFLIANASLLGVNPSELELTHLQPIMYDRDADQYKFTGLNYMQFRNDIPVFGSKLVLLVRNEKGYPLVQASVDLRELGDFNPDMNPRNFNPDGGIPEILKLYPGLTHFTEPEMVIWAGIEDMKAAPVMAYSFIGHNNYDADGGTPEKYRFITEATTGRILHEENLIIFTNVIGKVQGKATQGNAADICDQEVPANMPWARVTMGMRTVYTDQNGNFIIPNKGSTPVVVQSMLRGLWFRVVNRAGSNAVLNIMTKPTNLVRFMHNNPNKEEFLRAEVNGYLQANVVRDFVINYNPAYPSLQQNEFPVRVNETSGYCPGNAWYDYSSINFCLSGSGYPNTAFSTVIHHEYGHHLVAMAGSGQEAYGEGMGDVMGVLITDDPGLGYGFSGNCNGTLRSAVNNIQYPCSGEIHYCGQLLSGCVWETRNELAITQPDDYRDIISNLAINAMLMHTGSSIDPSITIDYLTLDDDNGNVFDGTPHYVEIDTGFSRHNMDAPPLALLGFSFPGGLPERVSPAGGTTVRVLVEGVTETPQPGTGMLYFNEGSGWQSIAMIQNAPNDYDAVFPATTCGNQVSYYFSADTTLGDTQFWPMGAPDILYSTVSADGLQMAFQDNFETDLGWTVENDPGLTDGPWDRGTPVGGGDRGDPPADFDGSGQCYLTDNVDDNSDVDDGITWLISPAIDLSSASDAVVSYALWYTNSYGNDPNNDLFKVYVSDNNGANWTPVRTFGPESEQGWNTFSFLVGDFVNLTGQVKVRFEASDLNEGSVVEAGVDDFSVKEILCN